MAAKRKAKSETAIDILRNSADHIESRAVERDQPNGEKSFAMTAELCNVMLGEKLAEYLTGEDIAMILLQLKVVRSRYGVLVIDDYEHMAAYAALAFEEAKKDEE